MPLETFFTPSQETWLFLYSCIMGAGLGVLYDIFRAARIIRSGGTNRTGGNGGNKLLIAVEDIIFWVLYAIAMLIFVIKLGRGQFRFYFMAGNALGFVLYFVTIGTAVVTIMKWVALAVRAVVLFIYRVIFKPILRLFAPIGKKIYNLFGKVHIYLKKHLKSDKKVLYNNGTRTQNYQGNKKDVKDSGKSGLKKQKKRRNSSAVR